jgi:hypothetical protein
MVNSDNNMTDQEYSDNGYAIICEILAENKNVKQSEGREHKPASKTLRTRLKI